MSSPGLKSLRATGNESELLNPMLSAFGPQLPKRWSKAALTWSWMLVQQYPLDNALWNFRSAFSTVFCIKVVNLLVFLLSFAFLQRFGLMLFLPPQRPARLHGPWPPARSAAEEVIFKCIIKPWSTSILRCS